MKEENYIYDIEEYNKFLNHTQNNLTYDNDEILSNKTKRTLLRKKVDEGFQNWVVMNNENDLEGLIIKSIHLFYSYDVDICFTHLDFMISYLEEMNVDKFYSEKFCYTVIIFYNYLKSIKKFDFFYIPRIMSFMGVYKLGEILFKNIVFDLNYNSLYNNIYSDGTTLEYFNMYKEELLNENLIFNNWIISNQELLKNITGKR